LLPLFEQWLDRHVPGQKEKVLGRIRELRGGALYDSRFGKRMSGEGPLAKQIEALFEVARRRAGLEESEMAGNTRANLTTSLFRVPTPQLDLFES
jgi:DNA repair photolyase